MRFEPVDSKDHFMIIAFRWVNRLLAISLKYIHDEETDAGIKVCLTYNHLLATLLWTPVSTLDDVQEFFDLLEENVLEMQAALHLLQKHSPFVEELKQFMRSRPYYHMITGLLQVGTREKLDNEMIRQIEGDPEKGDDVIDLADMGTVTVPSDMDGYWESKIFAPIETNESKI